MKKIFFLLIVLAHFSSNATHIVGAEMSYTYAGNNSFNVTVEVYHKCNTSIPLNTISLFVNSSCNNNCIPLGSDGLTKVNTENVNIGCNFNCQNDSYPNILKTTFTTIISLDDYNCGAVTVWIKVEDRAGSVFSTGGGYYQNYLYINNTNNYSNDSPVFSEDTYIIGCSNNSINYSPSYTDVQNDNVLFSFTHPLNGSDCITSTVSYVFPNSYTNPISTTGGFNLNASTGEINFTPNVNGTSFYAIKVQEYRNGILISETIRDGLINIIDCFQQQFTVSTGFHNWTNSTNPFHRIDIERYEANCFDFLVLSETNIVDVNLTGLNSSYFTYSVSGIGTTVATVSVCPNYENIPNDCNDLQYNFVTHLISKSPCTFDNSTFSSSDNYSILIKGNHYCPEYAYYTNIGTGNTANLIPPLTKVSKKIWVGDDMPISYNPLVQGTVGPVIWNGDFVMEAGEEIIIPSCQSGGTECVTLTGDHTFIIKPNNCNPNCSNSELEVKIDEIFECENEHLKLTINGGQPPYAATIFINGINISGSTPINTMALNIHDAVYGVDGQITYNIQVLDAVGNHFNYTDQVLGTANFYRNLSETGVYFIEFPSPQNQLYQDGWYYQTNHLINDSQPFFIADNMSQGPPWYGAHTIELTVWSRQGGNVNGFINELAFHNIWSVSPNDWSIDNGEVMWNGHFNNDINDNCTGNPGDVFFYRIKAENCSSHGNANDILNTNPNTPPLGLHYQTQNIYNFDCYEGTTNPIVNDEAHSQTTPIDSSFFIYQDDNALSLAGIVEPKNTQTINQNTSISIYPNPTTNTIYINGDLTLFNKVQVLDSSGKIIYESKSVVKKINLSDFESGTYLLKLELDNQIIIKRIIKQ